LNRNLGLSADLSPTLAGLAIVVALLGLGLLAVELWRRRGEGAWLVALSGALAAALALGAVLRPVSILSKGTMVGPRVLVLVDRSRSMKLPGDGGSRDEAAARALDALRGASKDARLTILGFGEGPPAPLEGGKLGSAIQRRSDLSTALREALARADEMPRALVVLSDGRLDAPTSEEVDSQLKSLLEGRGAPVHAIGVASEAPQDASVRRVRAAGVAVAHQPLSLTVEVGCRGKICSDKLPFTVRELLDGAPPALLTSGMAHLVDGQATLELSVTLDRAGPRLIEVAIEPQPGDEIRENDRRILAFDVARERVRLLHVAGRPTYDVRALRSWLKSNASVDVIAFFILRTESSNAHAMDNELALIRFPVDELFTEQLPTFDAVVLQDFNAEPYRLLKHLPNLARYVDGGGGLVMVGGPDAFLGGRYANTELERVLPVSLRDVARGDAEFDLGNVVPRPTAAGRAAPMLAPLRALFGDELPAMPGSNVVGDARPGALTLWEHPGRKTPMGKPMPLLTLGEFGDGRSVAIAVDGVHRLGFSEFAEHAAGRGHGALWDGLLGWLMRDPRFEPAQVELPAACVAGEPVSLRVTLLPGATGSVEVEVTAAGERKVVASGKVEIPANGGPVEIPIGRLAAGGYMARVKTGGGSSTRHAFPCEAGGDEWADSRPDEDRLRAVARATGGSYVRAADAGSIRFPAATEVSAERTVTPLLPPWLWALGSALALGAHWLARRRSGMA
jgi:uncharacterized membrane protein